MLLLWKDHELDTSSDDDTSINVIPETPSVIQSVMMKTVMMM